MIKFIKNYPQIHKQIEFCPLHYTNMHFFTASSLMAFTVRIIRLYTLKNHPTARVCLGFLA